MLLHRMINECQAMDIFYRYMKRFDFVTDAEIQSLCLTLAAKQSVSAPSAAVLIGAWVVSPLFNSLMVMFKFLNSFFIKFYDSAE